SPTSFGFGSACFSCAKGVPSVATSTNREAEIQGERRHNISHPHQWLGSASGQGSYCSSLMRGGAILYLCGIAVTWKRNADANVRAPPRSLFADAKCPVDTG